jgi:hypothetical protein
MTLIEGQDPPRPELLRNDHHGKVCQTQVQIRLPTIELERGFIVPRVQTRTLVAPSAQVFEECPTRGGLNRGPSR